MKVALCFVYLLASVAVYGLSLQQQSASLVQKTTEHYTLPNDGRFPAVRIQQGDSSGAILKMDKLDIDIKIVGNTAVTTMDMQFYNGLDRVLEGELEFPLGDGQTVSRFAMDVNGKLREGVVVEKARARIAFESIVRRKIDPGLLELTKGNTFRSRVYPILARGHKRIVVAYEQELLPTADGLLYGLPMQFPHAIDTFSFRAEVINESSQPDASYGEFRDIVFNQVAHSFRAEYNAQNFVANRQFVLLVPGTDKQRVVVEEHNGETFFSATVTPPSSPARRSQPRSICLLWDASGSGATRNKEREFAVLDEFFTGLGTCSVQLVSFSNTPEPPRSFRVDNGNWHALRSALDKIQFDGGTQLGALDLRASLYDEYILVSDGISNFGESEPALGRVPVVVLNSAQSAEHAMLRAIAHRTGGRYINLAEFNNSDAAQALLQQPYSLVSVQYSDGGAAEIYPSAAAPLRGGTATVTGKLLTPRATLTLNFGFGNTIVVTQTVVVDKARHSASTGITPRMWAQKKLAELDADYKKNKAAIMSLGQEFSLVTRNTSLIVLDRVADYIRYRIAPPESEPELLAAYVAALPALEKGIDQDASKHRRIEEVVAMFEQRKQWWANDFAAQSFPSEVQRNINGSYKEAEVMDDVLSPSAPSPDNDNDEPEERAEQQNTEELSTHIVHRYDGLSYSQSFDTLHVHSSFSFSVSKPAAAEYDDTQTASIGLKAWNPKTPYMNALKKASAEAWYDTYIGLKQDYGTAPGFFLDVANFFAEKGQGDIALRILSNIAELKLEDHQLLRILGNRLVQIGHAKLAVPVFRDILDLREEEPQSYRDLALALAADNQYQPAVDTLYALLQRSWDSRFPEVELIALTEMNCIINKAGAAVNTSHIDKRLIANMPVDMRVVLSWDANNCDIDLWVTEPSGEKCYYQHKQTKAGGRLSLDFTGGYGPEEYLIKRALQGTYKVQAQYYGNGQQRLAGPTTLQLTLFTNYGRKNETRKDITLRVNQTSEVIDIGEFEFASAKEVQSVPR